jgi:hypothetical protein
LAAIDKLGFISSLSSSELEYVRLDHFVQFITLACMLVSYEKIEPLGEARPKAGRHTREFLAIVDLCKRGSD